MIVTRLTIRSLLAHKARFLLATFAVVLGVGFVSGTFVLTDSLKHTFNGLFTEVNKGIDIQVRTKLAFGKATDTARDPISADVLPIVKTVSGVSLAEGGLFRTATMIDKKGKAITTQGAPTAAVPFDDNVISGVRLRGGRIPKGASEIVIDKATADDNGFAIGDPINVVLPGGARQFTIVGTIGQGKESGFAGATIVGLDPAVVSDLLKTNNTFDAINVAAAAGVDKADLLSRISAVLPTGIEAVDNAALTKETTEGINSFLTPFGNALLGFAFVALFVSAFIINNTFAIIVGQRVRELALLRAIGASAKQVRRLVIAEALIVGALASAIGLGLGILIAKGITALFDAAGAGFPKGTTIIAGRTIVFALVVGIGVTLASSLLPSRRASKVPPVAAMRVEEGFAALNSSRRMIVGAIATVVGAITTGIGLFVRPGGTWGTILVSAAGAVVLFLGASSLSGTVARPVTKVISLALGRLVWMLGLVRTVLGWPYRLIGRRPGRVRSAVPQTLARENAGRQPRRTSATASALMIGLALVSTFAVVGQSFKSTVADKLRSSVKADYFFTSDGFQGFPASFSRDLSKVEGLASVSSFRAGRVQIAGDAKAVGAIDPATFSDQVDIGMRSGSMAALTGATLLVKDQVASDNHLAVGSTVEATWPNGKVQTLEIVGTFHDSDVINANWLVSLSTFTSATTAEDNDFFVAARLAKGASLTEVRPRIEAVAKGYPQVKVQDKAEFQKGREDQINQLLVVINGLLMLAIIIAIMGIANTLALSVFERTRELGLMRAVGMSRRQMRKMVRWESVIVAVFGAVLGIVLGVPLGIALSSALPSSLVSTIDVPVSTLVTLVVVAMLAGVLAAALPARRAARLKILDAIAHQ